MSRKLPRKLPKWCKIAQIKMIEKDISVNSLADELGKTRQYVSMLINGRLITDSGRKMISDYLGIKDDYDDEDS